MSIEERAMHDEARPPLVLFVCEHGSAKSLIAALFLERMARNRGIAVRTVSRGISPDASVPPAVVAALREDGFDVAAFQPKAVTEAELLAASRVVSFGVDPSPLAAGALPRVERWDDVPPVSVSYSEARQAMLSRIHTLLRGLEQPIRR